MPDCWTDGVVGESMGTNPDTTAPGVETAIFSLRLRSPLFLSSGSSEDLHTFVTSQRSARAGAWRVAIMKRRLSNNTADTGEAPRRRRQPQISCNFCRSKKLKCDRGQPCSNCTNRGIPCEGQSPRVVSRELGSRLRRLEETVFGTSPEANHTSAAHQESRQAVDGTDETLTDSSSRPVLDRSNDLDYTNSGESLALDDCDTFTFRITGSGEYAGTKPRNIRCVDLPSREDALDLFKDYLDRSDFHVANILHPPSVQATISDVYTQLRQGHKTNLGSAALILSLCAASAFFWDEDFPARFSFLSEDNAANQSLVWRGAAWDLLDQAQRAASHNLDAIQARLILADLLYNIEGTTSRYRYIQSCARAAAYELRLHLIDLAGGGSTDPPVLREMKRRIWWYIASSDWLLSTMGGNVDRVYTVNPKHMRVNYPHHTSKESDPTVPSFGDSSETAVMHIIVRIRLAEILRDTVDALPLGSGDVDTLSYSQIAALDRRFEQILNEYPPFDMRSSPVDPASRRVAVQRAIGLLSVQARRARFLRPFIQIRNLSEPFGVFRWKCLKAAQTVLEMASSVLGETADSSGSVASDTQRSKSDTGSRSHRSPYQSGLIINHIFMACAVLAADPALRGGPDGLASRYDVETEQRRAQLANACRLLEKAGEKSPMALGMLTRLVGVLKKHRIHDVERNEDVSMEVRETMGSGASATFTSTRHNSFNLQEHSDRQGVPAGSLKSGLIQHQQQQQQPLDDRVWTNEPVDPNALTGIWNDFLGTNPTDSGWEQLFSDLDYLSGGI